MGQLGFVNDLEIFANAKLRIIYVGILYMCIFLKVVEMTLSNLSDIDKKDYTYP